MFDWLGDLISGIGDAIGGAFEYLGDIRLPTRSLTPSSNGSMRSSTAPLRTSSTMIGNMGAEIFDLSWVQATVRLFTLFGWSLFVAGTVVAIFDVAIEYQNGRANIKTASINILKGFFACSLIGVVPVELYKFCISLQNTFAHDLIKHGSRRNQTKTLQGKAHRAWKSSLVLFRQASTQATFGLLSLLCHDCFCLLRNQGVLPEYQARRYPARADGSRKPVYVQRTTRVFRRL
jgi:hypothetical protein